MRNAILKFKLIVMALGAILILSCSGDDGEDGAPGPQGIEGPAGVDGEDGNANVVSVLVSEVSIDIGTNIISIPELTQDIFDNGAVIGYVTVPTNTNRWESIPLVNTSQEVILDITQIRVGELHLVATFDQVLDFRFLLIAGTPSTGKTSKASVLNELKNAGIDINDYEAVINYFRLKK